METSPRYGIKFHTDFFIPRFTRTGLRVKTERTEYMWRGVRACYEHATYSRTGATYEKSVSNFTAVDTEFGT